MPPKPQEPDSPCTSPIRAPKRKHSVESGSSDEDDDDVKVFVASVLNKKKKVAVGAAAAATAASDSDSDSNYDEAKDDDDESGDRESDNDSGEGEDEGEDEGGLTFLQQYEKLNAESFAECMAHVYAQGEWLQWSSSVFRELGDFMREYTKINDLKVFVPGSKTSLMPRALRCDSFTANCRKIFVEQFSLQLCEEHKPGDFDSDVVVELERFLNEFVASKGAPEKYLEELMPPKKKKAVVQSAAAAPLPLKRRG